MFPLHSYQSWNLYTFFLPFTKSNRGEIIFIWICSFSVMSEMQFTWTFFFCEFPVSAFTFSIGLSFFLWLDPKYSTMTQNFQASPFRNSSGLGCTVLAFGCLWSSRAKCGPCLLKKNVDRSRVVRRQVVAMVLSPFCIRSESSSALCELPSQLFTPACALVIYIFVYLAQSTHSYHLA